VFNLVKSIKKKENYKTKTNQTELERLDFYFGKFSLYGKELTLEIKYENEELQDVIVRDDRGYIILSLKDGTVDYDIFMQSIGLQKRPDFSKINKK
jgi:hypothetical protein